MIIYASNRTRTYSRRLGGEVVGPHAGQLLHGILGALELYTVLLMQTELEQNALLCSIDPAHVDSIAKHWIRIVDRTIVLVLCVRKPATASEVRSNRSIRARLVGELSGISSRIVPARTSC